MTPKTDYERTTGIDYHEQPTQKPEFLRPLPLWIYVLIVTPLACWTVWEVLKVILLIGGR